MHIDARSSLTHSEVPILIGFNKYRLSNTYTYKIYMHFAAAKQQEHTEKERALKMQKTKFAISHLRAAQEDVFKAVPYSYYDFRTLIVLNCSNVAI